MGRANRKKQLTLEEVGEKIEQVDAILSRGATLSEACEKLGIAGGSTITYWRQRLKLAQNPSPKGRRHYTEEERVGLLKAIQADSATPIKDICLREGFATTYPHQLRKSAPEMVAHYCPRLLSDGRSLVPVKQRPPIQRIDLHLPEPQQREEKMVVLIGRPQDIQGSLELLSRIGV